MQDLTDNSPNLDDNNPSFADFGLPEAALRALSKLNYQTPTPIQQQAIPAFMQGSDVLGQAQTGTGKTAAFALPILATLQSKQSKPQCLILAPTRELAIQIKEAFDDYAQYLKQVRILAVCGGQSYRDQIQSLKQGVDILIGTPGRLMDLVRKNVLDLSAIKVFVLDEADEMLRMGFIEDVEWLLEHTPENMQVGLFSATMPQSIKKIADRYLKDPVQIKIQANQQGKENIQQKFLVINGISRIHALVRVLETESYEAAIVFAKTKSSTLELATELSTLGFKVAALNGDVPQAQRETTVDRLKKAQIDILIATDVAARGLDVDRIGLVVNYDMPFDSETYVHRIGRTGRANRTGQSILFVAQYERRYLKHYERASKANIEEMTLPLVKDINQARIENFIQKVLNHVETGHHNKFLEIIQTCCHEHGLSPMVAAASITSVLDEKNPLFYIEKASKKNKATKKAKDKDKEKQTSTPRGRSSKGRTHSSGNMHVYRIEVGRSHGVKPTNIVGAIANEGGLSSKMIGDISIHKQYSTLELPNHIPGEIIKGLRKVRVFGHPLQISKV